MKTNTKQFPKYKLFDHEVLEQTKKGLEKNKLSPNFTQNACIQFDPNFRPTRSLQFLCSLTLQISGDV